MQNNIQQKVEENQQQKVQQKEHQKAQHQKVCLSRYTCLGATDAKPGDIPEGAPKGAPEGAEAAAEGPPESTAESAMPSQHLVVIPSGRHAYAPPSGLPHGGKCDCIANVYHCVVAPEVLFSASPL